MIRFDFEKAVNLETEYPGRCITTLGKEKVKVIRWNTGKVTPYRIAVTIGAGQNKPGKVYYCTINGTCCMDDNPETNKTLQHIPLFLKTKEEVKAELTARGPKRRHTGGR